MPSFELLVYYQDAIIVLIKKRLGFNRHSIGSKRLSISAFPETIFVHLFESEPTFRYNPTQRKYYCQFQGKAGKKDLNKYLITNIGVFGKILKQKLQVMFYLLIMKEHIKLILVGM